MPNEHFLSSSTNIGIILIIQDLLIKTNSHLKRNYDFQYEEDHDLFKLILVSSSNINYRSPDLFFYAKNDKSVVVGLGKVVSKYNCDEFMGFTRNKLTCFKIGDSHINFHESNVLAEF